MLTNMYPPHHLGGYELSCRDVVERWRSRGHSVSVLTTTMRVDGVTDPPDERGHGVHRDLEFYYEDNLITDPPLLKTVAIERHNRRVLTNTLKAVSPDVVSVWHMGAMSQGLLTQIEKVGIPMVLSVCDDWLVYGPRVDPWMSRAQRRPRPARVVATIANIPANLASLGPANAFCFNSDWVRQRALRDSPYAIDNATVVYSGIDPDDFPVTDAPRPPWRWRLLCVGRQEERKGTHVAIEALRLLPDEATLDVVGPADDAYASRLADLATSLGRRDAVSFGTVARSALRDRYASADVFLFPVTWDEPFGLVPLEAMSCGVPVIATGTGGSAEFLVHEANCLLVPPGDEEGLAAAVRRLAEDERLRDTLVAGGRTTAAELSVDRLATALEAWHEAAASGFASGRPADLPRPAETLRAR